MSFSIYKFTLWLIETISKVAVGTKDVRDLNILYFCDVIVSLSPRLGITRDPSSSDFSFELRDYR